MANPIIAFAEYAPDISSLGTSASSLVLGCVPRADGFGPFKSFVHFTQALPARCRGYFFARKSDGSVAVFAGTATNLYKLNNSTYVWEIVSKAGGPYGDLVTSDNWQFAQFNDLVLAVQINTVPQKFILSSSTAFEDLGGSPPQASHIAIVNRFIVLSGLLAAARRAQWCDLDAPETWTAGTGLADYQDLPDGGNVHRVSGGDMYGVIFQDETIRSLTYSPGSAVTFQITRISKEDTLFARYSVAEVSGRTFFLSAQGFKVIDPGGTPRPIGKERVDRTFFADVDTGNLQLVFGVADPQATRVYWAYKSGQGSAGLFDKVLCYDWSIGQSGKWSLLPLMGEFLASLARPGLTLEQLDAIAPTALLVTGAADNGSGLIRLTLNAISNADFAIAGQNFIVVQGVVGTTEANGTWVAAIIDSTHIDLVGSAFVHAYVSGGKIGGSLDALPFSLDSVSTASLAALSAIDSDHKAGFFTGDNIEASMETPEQDLEGSMVFISGARPITDCATAVVSIGGRDTAQSTVVYTDEAEMDSSTGQCPILLETRYPRARFRAPAGAVWTYARGIEPEAQLAGDR